MRNYYKAGTWNCICMLCGKEVKSDEIKRRWDGLYVCASDWEPRNILDFQRNVGETSSVPWTSPEPTDQFINVIYVQDTQAIAGVGVAGLAITGTFNPNL